MSWTSWRERGVGEAFATAVSYVLLLGCVPGDQSLNQLSEDDHRMQILPRRAPLWTLST